MTGSTNGIMAAIMTGQPIPLPSIACALCLASREPARVQSGQTMAAGWLVCAEHARVLAAQLDRQLAPAQLSADA